VLADVPFGPYTLFVKAMTEVDTSVGSEQIDGVHVELDEDGNLPPEDLGIVAVVGTFVPVSTIELEDRKAELTATWGTQVKHFAAGEYVLLGGGEVAEGVSAILYLGPFSDQAAASAACASGPAGFCQAGVAVLPENAG
jgi:hypothetical protein